MALITYLFTFLGSMLMLRLVNGQSYTQTPECSTSTLSDPTSAPIYPRPSISSSTTTSCTKSSSSIAVVRRQNGTPNNVTASDIARWLEVCKSAVLALDLIESNEDDERCDVDDYWTDIWNSLGYYGDYVEGLICDSAANNSVFSPYTIVQARASLIATFRGILLAQNDPNNIARRVACNSLNYEIMEQAAIDPNDIINIINFVCYPVIPSTSSTVSTGSVTASSSSSSTLPSTSAATTSSSTISTTTSSSGTVSSTSSESTSSTLSSTTSSSTTSSSTISGSTTSSPTTSSTTPTSSASSTSSLSSTTPASSTGTTTPSSSVTSTPSSTLSSTTSSGTTSTTSTASTSSTSSISDPTTSSTSSSSSSTSSLPCAYGYSNGVYVYICTSTTLDTSYSTTTTLRGYGSHY